MLGVCRMNRIDNEVRLNALTINEISQCMGGYHRCLMDEGYPFLYVSQKFLELLGWTKEELANHFDNKFLNMIHPDDRDIQSKSIFRILGKDGYHWISDSMDIEDHHILHGNIADITKFIYEKEKNDVLSSLTKDYTSLIICDLKEDTIQIIKQDEKAYSTKLNRHCYTESMHHFYDHYLIHESCPEYIHILSREPLMKRLRDKGSFELKYQIYPNENGAVNISLKAVFLYEDENHFNVTMAFRPVDEIIKKEKVLELQREIIEGLGKEYFSVLLLDLEQGQIFSYREVSEDGKRISDFCREYENRWCKFLPAYATKMVSEESRENFLKKLSYEALCTNTNDFSMTYEYMAKDGILYHQMRVVYVKKKDRTRAAVIGTRNIDDLIKKERLQEAELKAAYIAAEEANQAKTDFLNNMSHDIRTPMNVILGYNQLMKEKMQDPLLLDYQNKIEQSGKLLLSIINNVLDMARIESGKAVLDEKEEMISDIAEELVSVFESSAMEKDIEFISNIDVRHNHVWCDGTKVREIMMNLVGNAFKYTPNKGKVWVCVKELDDAKKGYVKICTQVKDNEIGMSEEYLPTLFDSFSREHNTTIGKVSGTGLGMSIVKKLVDMMGGEIFVESKLNVGSCFTVILEHRLVDEKNNKSIMSENMEHSHLALKGRRVLLAEDNDLNAEIAMAILENTGLIIDRVEDGLMCVNQLDQMPDGTYDLILMDVQMPNMDGYSATQRIRHFKNKQKASIPILAMTANAFDEDKKMALQVGMNGHISKPIDAKSVEKAIMSMLLK